MNPEINIRVATLEDADNMKPIVKFKDLEINL